MENYKIYEDEVFKPIEGYNDVYHISNYGRVISKFANKIKIMKQGNTTTGYLKIQFKRKGKFFNVHRLVAIAFIENKENKPQVNHINGDKKDNRVINLEWVTQSENQLHAYKIGLQKPIYGRKINNHCKKINVYDLQNNFIAQYPSIVNCSDNLNLRVNSIHRVLSGVRKKYNNKIFKYA
jgi:hypothetical protein